MLYGKNPLIQSVKATINGRPTCLITKKDLTKIIRKKPKLPAKVAVIAIALLTLVVPTALSFEGVASWYDSQSVVREGTCKSDKCYTASGNEIHALESKGTDFAASNDFPLGTRIRVCGKDSGACVVAVVLDRGGFSKYGRSVDLAKKTFKKIAPLRRGLAQVTVNKL